MNHSSTGFYRIRVVLAVCAVLTLLAGLQLGGTRHATAQSPANNHNVFLPLAANAKNTPTEPPPAASAGVFLETKLKTNSSAAAIDSNGIMHMAYVGYVPYGDPSPAYYATCAQNCEHAASWSSTAVGEKADEVQLALTPAGQPRLLLATNEHHFIYAACDTQCANAAQWQTVDLEVANELDISLWDKLQHYFALDPQGMPRFVFFDDNGMNHTYYVYCVEDCTSGAEGTWSSTVISWSQDFEDEEFHYPALQFTPAGQPRILVNIATHFGDGNGLYYLACDEACDQPESWQRTRITDSQATWDLEIDSAGRPRAVMYGTPSTGQGLRYGWCNGDCLDASGWQFANLPVGQGGEDPDMALDANDHPRITYHAADAAGLGYASCDTGCESAAGQWQTSLLEASSKLDGTFDVAVPFGCDQAGWVGGYRSSLALDPQGNPRVAYDALFLARCFYTAPNDPTPRYGIETLWRSARWLTASKP